MKLLFVSLTLTCVLLNAAQNVGYVLEKEGDWTLAGNPAPLKGGEAVPAGALPKIDKPKDGDTLVIADLNGDLLKRVRCAKGACHECRSLDICEDDLKPLPTTKPQPGLLAASFDAAMELLFGKADRYSVHRVRGEELADAVVTLDQDHADLAAVLYQLDNGKYNLRWRDLTHPTAKPQNVPIEAVRGRPTTATLTGFSPGLYELTLLEKGQPSPNTAWVFLASPTDSVPAAAAFQQSVSRAAKWGPSVTPNASRAYLRASLDDLARRTLKPDANPPARK